MVSTFITENIADGRNMQTQVTDAGLGQLTDVGSLRHLDVRHTAVTADGVARLQRALPQCKIVYGIAPNTKNKGPR